MTSSYTEDNNDMLSVFRYFIFVLRQLNSLTVCKMLNAATRLRLHRGQLGPICLTTQILKRSILKRAIFISEYEKWEIPEGAKF